MLSQILDHFRSVWLQSIQTWASYRKNTMLEEFRLINHRRCDVRSLRFTARLRHFPRFASVKVRPQLGQSSPRAGENSGLISWFTSRFKHQYMGNFWFKIVVLTIKHVIQWDVNGRNHVDLQPTGYN